MATIVTRSGKGSPLTHAEVDSNFTNLNTDKLELSGGTMTGNLSFGDNDKAIFGAGSDLQIYHDGANSYISEVGTGDLYVRGSNFYITKPDGSLYFSGSNSTGEAGVYFNNSKKLATTSTGVDITGTLTSDGLTVDGDGLFQGNSGMASGSGTPVTLQIKDVSTGSSWVAGDVHAALDFFTSDGSGVGNGVRGRIGVAKTFATGGSSSVNIQVAPTTAGVMQTALQVDPNGDISFYEDTGTTAKLTWDASAESLQIGSTTSDESRLFVYKNDATYPAITVRQDGAAPIQKWLGLAGAERMRIDSSGNVGIGVTNPSDFTSGANNLVVGTGSGDQGISIYAGLSSDSSVFFVDSSSGTGAYRGQIRYRHDVDDMSFHTAGGFERMRIDSSGNVGIGRTSSSHKLEVHGELKLTNMAAGEGIDIFDTGSAQIGIKEGGAAGVANMVFETANTERMRIDSSGNVGLFGDGGTQTIDNYSNYTTLTLSNSTGAIIQFEDDGGIIGELFNGTNHLSIGSTASGASLRFRSGAASEAMRIDSSGNVGIGTSSPAANHRLTLDNAGFVQALLSTSGTARLSLYGDSAVSAVDAKTNPLALYAGSSERMRIDSSGNLLVGKTSSNSSIDGTTIFSSGYLATTVTQSTANSGSVAQFRRGSTDGSIVNFLKDGSTVGSIGTSNSYIYIGEGDVGLAFRGFSDYILPWNPSTNSTRDNAINIGDSAYRFKDLYLSGGVYLGGTGSANKLDDYEEGTWTPVYSVGTSGSVTMSTVTAGYYVKIGKMVQISFQISTASISSPTGTIEITGLPFAVSSQSDNRGGCAIGFAFRFATAFDNLRVGFVDGESKMRLNVDATNATSSTKVVGSDLSSTNNGNYFYASGTYQTE